MKWRDVLLVGGPKHGQFIYTDADSYEFVQSTILAGVGYSPNDDRYQSNQYAKDETLTRLFGRDVFTHNVINGQFGGGEILPTLNQAKAKLESAEKSLTAARDRIKTLESDLEGVREVRDGWEERAKRAELRLHAIRTAVERMHGDLKIAAAMTGFEYVSDLDQVIPEG